MQTEIRTSSVHWWDLRASGQKGESVVSQAENRMGSQNDNAFYSSSKDTARVAVLCRSGKAPFELSIPLLFLLSPVTCICKQTAFSYSQSFLTSAGEIKGRWILEGS